MNSRSLKTSQKPLNATISNDKGRTLKETHFIESGSETIDALYRNYLEVHGVEPLHIRSKTYQVIQRISDILLSTFALLILLPFFGIIAILIKLDSKGPVLYRHQRVGINGKLFEFFKFRTMCDEAEDLKLSLLQQNEAEGPMFKMKDDPRVTRVGRLLRRTSLDEFPQFLNVFLGQMSIIGPRPHLAHEVVAYEGKEWMRLEVKPGLMCYREIYGRSKFTFEEWVEMDIQYLSERSFFVDLKMLVKGFISIIKRDGAW